MERVQFSTQLLQNHDYLKGLALKFTHNSQDAADLHQETLCKALEHFENYRNGVDLAPWLYVIMRNIFINIYRKKKRGVELIYTRVEGLQLDNRLEASYNLETYTTAISSEIDKLPGKFRIPFILYVNGYKYTEIANFLQKPLGTIKSHIHIARQMLQIAIKS